MIYLYKWGSILCYTAIMIWRNIIMIKNSHKIISVVLCLAMVLCACLAIGISAGAAQGDTIYVRLNNGWDQVYCYMWNSDSDTNAAWPGEKMTATSESGIFSYKLSKDFANVIFTNGTEGDDNRTVDLDYSLNGGDGKIYDLGKSEWSQYSQPEAGTTQQATQATQETQATQASRKMLQSTGASDGTTVFLRNTANWSQPYCYMWNSTSDNNAWPGKPMTKVEDNIWMYTAPKTYANCIFNPGSSNGQTSDLNNIQSGYLYDYGTGRWEAYDLSPIRISEFTATPGSDLYVGMEIKLSTTAASAEGTVSYKFSVNGSVIRDFGSGNSVYWTPNSAGTYTVAFNYRDTAGNENSRNLTLTVASDSGVSKPILKKVTPSDGTYVQTGSAATVSVTAGGGQTGTNLLFYKYVVEDPAGAFNTAYYTLNSTYHFTPTRTGVYKITVYVQASDNTTVNKSFTLNATGGDIPTSDPITQPTQPTQPTSEDITIEPYTPPQPISEPDFYLGDVNMDGKISIKDATHIQLYLAEFKGFTVTVELADMDGDGYVSIKDVTAIQRYLAEE